MAEPPRGSISASTSPPFGRRDQLIASEKNAGSANSSFNGSVNLSASNSSGIERSGSVSKRSKEDVKRDKEEEKSRKKDLKKEKERAKISQSLGLPEGEKILHGTVLCFQIARYLTLRRVFMRNQEGRSLDGAALCNAYASAI